ncbi:alanine--tRNA ligase [Propionimicrobium sp. PCR01-08-3]|uniref:alanine--tRNA ligase n=1 Tax=Propionimicrobium sp. PCR01-08-3 TaxID=3052086 RepID=UPI00255CF801|nr:alanine--tRNA ligase [Propionimicrobium sp. PCR01-08-3]WIY83889.1 alanine--tRNA ligase [Propionimicrobium sp. PCR01-08-3]
MKAAEIGRRYVDFFAAHGHTVVPSASLLYNDPTLLFVNAGMVPFKPYFIGAEPSPYKRAVSLQKCVRTLDIEDVGKTTRHGTFFQMLGNFSFGDYFKKEAIEWAWELVTGSVDDGGFGFDPAKVWVTVLGPGLHPAYPDGDVEAIGYWKSVGVPAEHIQARGLKDNYWNMGIPGPGGPCSEIYIDRGPEYGPDGGPNADEDRYLEIWNLVFQQEDLSVVRAKDDFDIAGPLPSKNIDTGAGLERIALLMQGVDNMYETDEVFPVIAKASEMSGKKYGADHVNDVRLRVIGDHVRSSLMLMTDGVAPGNEARGYVLRRLLRRSIRSMRLLGYGGSSLVELLDVSRGVMHASYPDIDEQWERIRDISEAEEQTFTRTLTSGTALFDTAVRDVRSAGGTKLSGDKAFQLHDTYGFPIDLTLEMAAEQGLSVDQDAFRTLMDEQRQRAKADARAKKGGVVSTEAYQVLRAEGETPFLGYTDLSVDTKVRGLIADGETLTQAPAGSIVEVVLAETPFYAESGGQDSDRGVLRTPAGELEVLDVQRPVPGLIVHKVKVPNELVVGDDVTALVDGFNRRGACQAHSATHVLHAALRELVGSGATQAGSFNKPGYLRFDYSSTKGLSPELRAEIEERCNVAIRDDLAVSATQMKLEDAKALGAMAMFGEKYPPIVRMVEMGGPWSRELCGGTHVEHSSQIGLLSVLGEQSVGSGARRVEALVSTDAFAHMAAERALVSQLSDTLRVQPDQLGDRVQSMVAELKQAQKTIADLRMGQLQAQTAGIVQAAHDIDGVAFAAQVLADVNAGDLRTLAAQVRDKFGSRAAVVVLISTGVKPSVVVAVNGQARDLGIKAGEIVRRAAAELGGKGGGKDDMAQGGGSNSDTAPQAVEAARHEVETVLGR